MDADRDMRRMSKVRQVRDRWTVAGLILVAFGLAHLVACDTFTPRDPEEPGEIQPIILLSDPDSIYVSMQLGLSSKFINTYINAFDPDDFVFHPDPQDSAAMVQFTSNPELYDNWSRQVEEQVHSSVFGQFDSLRLTFVGNARDSTRTTDLVTMRKEYLLTADQRTFRGLADWTMILKGGEWRISLWLDTRIDTSWSVLRGENR